MYPYKCIIKIHPVHVWVNAPNEMSCRRWFSRLKTGYLNLEDESRDGCPKGLDSEDLASIVTTKPVTTVKEFLRHLMLVIRRSYANCKMGLAGSVSREPSTIFRLFRGIAYTTISSVLFGQAFIC